MTNHLKSGDPIEVRDHHGRWNLVKADSRAEYGWICAVGLPARAGSVSVRLTEVHHTRMHMTTTKKKLLTPELETEIRDRLAKMLPDWWPECRALVEALDDERSLHEVAKAFHDLAVMQRDLRTRECDAMAKERDVLLGQLRKLVSAAESYTAMIDQHAGDDFLPAVRRGPRMELDALIATVKAIT